MYIYLCVVQVSVVHSVQGGYLDKALAYSEKAMQFMVDTERDRGRDTDTSLCVCVHPDLQPPILSKYYTKDIVVLIQ